MASVSANPHLGGLLPDINSLIGDSKNIGKDALIEAAIEVRRTIEQAQVCYANSPDKKDQGVITQLETLIKGLKEGQEDAIGKAKITTKQINNDLPFSDRKIIPQLTTASPQIVLATDKTIHFIYRGNFDQVQTPILKFGDEIYQSISAERNKLEFDVPFEKAFEKKVLDGIGASLTGRLELPYKENTPPAIFSVFVRSIPPSPGTVDLKSTTVHKVKETTTLQLPFPTRPRYITETVANKRSIELKWGDCQKFSIADLADRCRSPSIDHCLSRMLQCTSECATSWKIELKDFRGEKHEFTAAGNCEYLTIQIDGEINVKAPASADLKELK